MSIELRVPEVGESITEVQIGTWLKAEGDFVTKDEGVVEIESDKATLELPAPETGRISRILKKQGDKARVGDVIGEMEPGGETAGKPMAEPPAAEAMPEAAPQPAREPIVMPAAARLLAEHGISAADVAPTGSGGRLLKEDVLRHIEGHQKPSHEPHETPTPPPTQDESEDGYRQEEAVPMSPLRLTIARRLVEAQQTAALLTSFNEVDMGAVIALRKEHQEGFQARYGVKLGFMSFFVKAAVDALQAYPQVNARVRGEDIVYHNYCDIGIAVGGGKGLVVPVLRSAETLSFAEIEKAIGDFAARAKENRIGLDELRGGTFTISNGGIYGSMLSTPIVNPPQSGILGLHAIQDRPVASNGEVVVRPMMYIALTYDHRIVDGREAVGFLKRVRECVENPVRMLIEI